MLASTDGNCARAFTLGSHDCLSTSSANFFPLSVGMLLHPSVSFHNFSRVGCGGEDLCDQRVWI